MPLESTLSLSAPAGDTQPLACAYWLADTARSRFLFVSSGFEALWGRPVSALHEDPSRYLASVHPDDLAQFADTQPAASGRRQRLFRLRQPDGSYRAVAECTFSMISPFGGEPRLAGVLFEQPADPAQLPEDWLAGRESIVDELAGLYQRSISNDDNLRHLFAYSAIAVIVLDAEGYVCEWNREAERLLGWPDSAALGRPLAALLVPAPLHNRFHDWLFSDDGGAMAQTMRPLEIPALHSNGSRVPLELSGWQFVLSGLPYRGITLRDMTRQHVAEQVLYEHMERARMLFEFASIAMVVLDHTGVIIDWNIHAEQIFGLHGEQAVGRPLLEVLPLSPEQLPAGLLLGDQGMQLAEATSLEFTLQRDGQLQHVDASFWPFSSSQQGFIGAFFRDISARRRSEDALRQSEEHYRLVIDNVRDGIVVVQGMRIVLSNPRAAEISGYSIAELAEVDFASLIHPDDQGRVLDMHRRRVGGEQVEARDDLRVVNKNGEVRWVD
ncbi:MAG: PAS domain S-box protein, partial [Vogesella sp.]|uniref:PAS domain-containing protein n=1 Tax=Vogesella sp. TaxID=1904252 RepID=UPI003F310868